MIGQSRLYPGFARVPVSVAPKTFAHYAGHCGRLLVQSVQHAYDAHQEKAQMRFAPTEPRSWHDVRRAVSGRN